MIASDGECRELCYCQGKVGQSTARNDYQWKFDVLLRRRVNTLHFTTHLYSPFPVEAEICPDFLALSIP